MKSYDKFIISEFMRRVDPVKIEELKSCNTRQLLNRLQDLRRLLDSPDFIDWTKEEIDIAQILQNNGDAIFFKDSIIWKHAVQDVKTLLEDREHIPRINKKTNKAKRQQVAWEKKNR